MDIIDIADALDITQIKRMGQKAKKRIKDAYAWNAITQKYENIFLNNSLEE